MKFFTLAFNNLTAIVSHPLFLAQVAALLVCAAVAWLLKLLVNRRLRLIAAQRSHRGRKSNATTHFLARVAPPLIGPLFFLVALKVGIVVLVRYEVPFVLLDGLAKLVLVWLIVRFVGLVAGDTAMVRTIGFGLWALAALSLVGLLNPTAELLDGMHLTLGKVKFSALDMVKGLVALIVLIWLAGVVSDASERRIQNQKALRVASRTLIVKLVRVTAYAVAVMITLSVMGIDLTALAVFGGALGVGIGLGLQKVVANFVGGIILLAEKSITPGDTIEFGGVNGKVKFLGVRFVCLDTGDGKEHIIPNEELITKTVVNWSRVDTMLRGSVLLPMAHGQSFEEIRQVLLDCCAQTEGIIGDPAPFVMIERLTLYAMEVTLQFWIADLDHGMGGIRSNLITLILQRFHEKGLRLATLAGPDGMLLSMLPERPE